MSNEARSKATLGKHITAIDHVAIAVRNLEESIKLSRGRGLRAQGAPAHRGQADGDDLRRVEGRGVEGSWRRRCAASTRTASGSFHLPHRSRPRTQPGSAPTSPACWAWYVASLGSRASGW